MSTTIIAEWSRGAGSVPKLEEQERTYMLAHFYPCNAIGPMLNFAKVGGAATPLPPSVPVSWEWSKTAMVGKMVTTPITEITDNYM